MKILKKIAANYLFPACLFYTVLSLLLASYAAASRQPGYAPSLSTLLCLFVFSLGLAALNRIFLLKEMPAALRLLLHYIGTVILFFIVFFLLAGRFENGRGALLLLAIYTVLYLIAAAVILAIRHLIRREDEKEQTYTSQFRK